GEELLVGARVRSEPVCRFRERASQKDGRLVVEWMRDGSRRVYPAQPVLGERQASQERRQHPHGVTAGAHVVHEPRKGELRAPYPAADRVPSREDADRSPRPRELDGGGKPVGTRADDDGVVHRYELSPWSQGFRLARSESSAASAIDFIATFMTLLPL